jgi:integrase
VESTEKKPRGKRGQGCIYRPKNSRNYWIKFSVNGLTIQQSANTESKRAAWDELKAQILRYSNGEAVDSNRVTIAALEQSMMQAWKNLDKDPATIEWAGYCWKRLLPYFGGMKANAISSAAINGYMEKRKAEGAANGTINRELTVLSVAFTMAYNETPRRVSQKLSFTRLPEPRGRQGFVEQKQYGSLAANCSELYMRAMLALGYSFGFRSGELIGKGKKPGLKVSDVDLLDGTVRLRTSKNGDPRQVNLTKETQQLLAACCAGKSPEDAVFTRNGKPVKDFRGAWHKLCCAAGLGQMICRECSKPIEQGTKCKNCPSRRHPKYIGLIFHDQRRSAVRNMIRAGIPEVVCMKISGHKTRAVFDRYNIVSERDLTDAAKKIESSQLSYSLVKVEQVDENAKSVQNESIQ